LLGVAKPAVVPVWQALLPVNGIIFTEKKNHFDYYY